MSTPGGFGPHGILGWWLAPPTESQPIEITQPSFRVSLLELAGHDTAERYVAFSAVEAKRGLQEYLNCQDELGYEPFPEETIESINAKFDAAIGRYGKPFGTPHGWAAHYLRVDKPGFADIEKAVDRAWQRSHYKMASYNVHAGPHAAYFRLGLVGGTEGYLAGPSNAGLHEPGKTPLTRLPKSLPS